MSHEIRTPLNAIIGITHLLEESAVTEDQQEMLKLMDYSSKSLLGIVNDILESSQIDAGKITIQSESTDVIDLLQTICGLTRPLAEEKGLELKSFVEEDVPALIMGDALRLNQILINLINNAIKFTDSGQIEVCLNVVDKDEESALLQFKVKDTGIGLSASSIDRIFERFEQIEDKTWQKFGGTGLGLSIVKRLIELMGGEIKVESEVGRGTTFTFLNRFKLSKETTAANQNTEPLTLLSKFHDINILMAEDNIINQFVAIKILKSWNVTVDVAENGLEAFEKLKHKDYSLILMDTHMPVMNGIEATKKIRNEFTTPKKDTPIISFSASVIDYEKNAALEAGVNDFIDKPFDPKSLHDKIFRLLEDKAH
jgi:CheY-like chemotaxis protein